MNLARVGESSWGNLELASGQFNFGWLRDFLDQMHRRGISAILGTSTYISTAVAGGGPSGDAGRAGTGLRSFGPHEPEVSLLNHPLYRAACRRYIQALAGEFHDHPAVIGWQLDNEIEFVDQIICYNPGVRACMARVAEADLSHGGGVQREAGPGRLGDEDPILR